MEAVAHKTRKRGFSLIEAAIVLAVVGGVIGGIWYSAAAVIDKWKAERLATAILSIVEGTRKLFPMQFWPAYEGSQISVSLDNTLIAAGIVPADMVCQNNTKICDTITGKVIGTRLLVNSATGRAIYIGVNLNTKSQANAVMTAVLTSQKGTENMASAYCADQPEAHWWGWPSQGWPPDCPSSAAGYVVFFYFKP